MTIRGRAQIHQSRVGGEVPSLAKVNVNKVSIFNGILYVVPVAVHFHYIMRLCGQPRSEDYRIRAELALEPTFRTEVVMSRNVRCARRLRTE